MTLHLDIKRPLYKLGLCDHDLLESAGLRPVSSRIDPNSAILLWSEGLYRHFDTRRQAAACARAWRRRHAVRSTTNKMFQNPAIPGCAT